MFVSLSRAMTLAMAAIVAFGLLVPIAARDHHTWLVIAIVVCFVGYLAANVVIWRRMRPRT